MKAAIVLFSPSGNTLGVGKRLEYELVQHGIDTQLVDITRERDFFNAEDRSVFLTERIKPHDVLFIGAPVYAHHLQYHVMDIIHALPLPDQVWGNVAVPFVTFGGVNSGVALDEAGQLLVSRGRIVLAGLKVASSHRMTRGFLKKELNSGLSEERMNKPIKKIVESIKQGRFTDRHQDLRYHGEEVYRLAKTVFLEKKCHETMYPNIKIDPKACCRCGECASVCPVCHLEQNSDGAIRTNDKSPCIHCFNCVVACKIHAISLCGELDKARAFFNQLVAKGMETPGTDVYPRNL